MTTSSPLASRLALFSADYVISLFYSTTLTDWLKCLKHYWYENIENNAQIRGYNDWISNKSYCCFNSYLEKKNTYNVQWACWFVLMSIISIVNWGLYYITNVLRNKAPVAWTPVNAITVRWMLTSTAHARRPAGHGPIGQCLITWHLTDG